MFGHMYMPSRGISGSRGKFISSFNNYFKCNSLYSVIKDIEWLNGQKTLRPICCLQETHSSFKTIWTETGAFHPIAAEYTLFADTYSTFSRIYYMLGTKQVLINLGKLK